MSAARWIPDFETRPGSGLLAPGLASVRNAHATASVWLSPAPATSAAVQTSRTGYDQIAASMFGSDFPNIPYSYADAMRSITRVPGVDDAWLRGVLYENAAALFSPTARP